MLCELEFEGAPQFGQQLLDERRREQLLPHDTVFMIVTGLATHARVVDAAESTVDGYLLKPYSAAALADRLSEALRRKKSLDAVYKAIQSGQFAQADVVARRHAKAIGDITPWMERTTRLQGQWCRPLTHIAGIRRSVRTPGGVVLRT